MADQKGVEAVDRALKILDCFSVGTQEISLAELSRLTGFYKSTILRLAVSLERSGYLVRGESGMFRLGPATWRLGSCYRQSFDLADVLRPELKTLCEETNETASFYIREGDSRVCLYRTERPEPSATRSTRGPICHWNGVPAERFCWPIPKMILAKPPRSERTGLLCLLGNGIPRSLPYRSQFFPGRVAWLVHFLFLA